MSEQKKAAVKPTAKKLSSTANRKFSRKTPAKTGVKAASAPLKKPPRKISPDEKGLIEESCISRDITERKRIEGELRESGERYRSILDDTDEGYCEIDLEGNITFINHAGAKIIGYAPQEITGENFRRFVAPADEANLLNVFKNIYKTRRTVKRVESPFIDKDGNTRFLEISGAVLCDAAGNPVGFRGMYFDITERKWAKEALQQSEAKYASVIENIGVAYFETDLRGVMTFVNDQTCLELGYSREELMRMSAKNFQTAANAKKTFNVFHQVYETGEPAKNYEMEAIHKNGDIVFFELSILLQRDAMNKPIGFRGLARNVTLRKKMETELQQSEERYRTILEEIEEGYAELDLACHWTFVNEAAAKILGYPPQELAGVSIRRNMDDLAAQELLELYQKLHQTGQSFKHAEIELITKEDNRRIAEFSGVMIWNDEGRPAGFRSLIRDITEHKWSEDALLQSEAKYFSIIESIGDAYFETDLRGMMTFVNDRTCLDLGYTFEELLRMCTRDYQTPENAKKTFDVFKQVYETGQPVKAHHFEAIRKDGAKVIFEMSISLMRNSQGRPIGFRGLSRDITERRRMEDAIRASEEKFRKTFMISPDAIAITRLADGMLISCNDKFYAIYGYAKEDLVGKTILEINIWGKPDERNRLLEMLKRDGVVNNFETGLLKKDGEAFQALLSASIIELDGAPHVLSLIRDVTERNEMKEKFRRVSEIHNLIMENTTLGVGIVRNRVIEWCNARLGEMLQLPLEKLHGQPTRILYPSEEEAKEMLQSAYPVLARGERSDNVLRLKRSDGTMFWCRFMGKALNPAKPFDEISIWLLEDFTERKQVEDALKASEERARTIIATIPDPYFENDLRGKFTYVNSAFKIYSGYTDDEIKDASFKIFVDASYVDELFSLYNSVYTTGLPIKNVELEAIMKSGERRLVNLSVSLIRDSQGNATGFSGIVRDITDKKKAEQLIRQSEQSLREHSETLELRVRERTAELEKAKIAAEAASRAKSDFMSHISHEFQTPLNAVIGFTKVLHDRMFGEINEKQEEFLRYIADAGANLSRIITQIVDASQATSGHMKLNLSSVSVVEAISRSTRLVAPLIEEKNQILTVNVDLDADVSIEGDGQKIQQIFFNLLSNAVKYTGDGGNISIQASRKAHPASLREGVSVAIKDTGIGIKASDIPRLFEAFGTLESTYTRSEKGIGVGLSLTKQLVELHGGDIGVESEFGSGSCFTVFLPLKQKSSPVKE